MSVTENIKDILVDIEAELEAAMDSLDEARASFAAAQVALNAAQDAVVTLGREKELITAMIERRVTDA